ncbi:MAG: DNA recombination protein RmuC [Bacteroidetes bacterium]|nr:DNA recombination protein RmuC [Bacteroidota bacterium]
MDLMYLIVGIVVGALLSYLFLKMRSKDDLNNASSLTMNVEREKAVLLQQVDDLRGQVVKAEQISNSLQIELKELNASKVKAETVAQSLEARLTEHKSELETIRVQMKEQFSAIASDIVLKNSQRIQDDHKTKLDDILNPLKDKIEKFETQVRTSHEERIKENQSLKEQLVQLQTMNKSIGDEARNLVSALKGQAKTQGNWGEMILEKILERSGLVKGREYFVQSSLQSDEGKRFQPDVIISLPEGRSIVVDAKVSLIAYERYANEEDDVAKALALREHLSSVRKHIKDLSGKNYQSLHGINTLDFVLLFIPVEPAFALAIEQDHELFNEAFEKNIVLVTTSTLLATLRTIASIWRLEYQNKNAVEIARQSGDLYDKFSALIDDMISVGKKMNDAQSAYESTMNKLHTGRGNLVSRVESLKKLGVKTTKQINQKLIDRTEDMEELDEGNEDVNANMQSK